MNMTSQLKYQDLHRYFRIIVFRLWLISTIFSSDLVYDIQYLTQFLKIFNSFNGFYVPLLGSGLL